MSTDVNLADNYYRLNTNYNPIISLYPALIERRKQAASDVQPPDIESLNAARELRMKEIAMEALLKEIIIYAIFVLVVFFLSYQARDSDSFMYAENIKNTFFRNTPAFDGVKAKFYTNLNLLIYWNKFS